MASQAALAAVHAALKQDSGRADSLLAGLQAAGFSYSAEVKLESNEQEENLALAFRMALEESLVRNNAANRNAITDESVVALLDLSVEAAMRGWVPRQLPLMAMHELFEGQTAKQCGLAFEYLEKRVDKLSELTEQGEHKYSQAALLRCCNTLMQRLSKSSELLLCGRVLMFLAHILPLAEKSGVNLKGDFNKANVTEYEEELAGEEEERLAAEGGNAKEFKLRSTDEKLDGQMEDLLP
ncbi:THO complex subunit 1 transcription elongation factor-domain-containing protein [Baffinella frigidus]|nr:THO complex subunit 1 transcription elongation factor-domain-containing protein [Cryptophyta sp. CCMP2293]